MRAFLSLCLFSTSQVFASFIETPISNKYNWLNLKDLVVTEVVTGSEDIIVQNVASNKRILLISKGGVGTEYSISLITNIGASVDLKLKVAAIEPQVIDILLPLTRKGLNVVPVSRKDEQTRFLNQILNGEVQFEPLAKKKIRNINHDEDKQLKLKLVGYFKGYDYRASVIEAKYLGKTDKTLNDFLVIQRLKEECSLFYQANAEITAKQSQQLVCIQLAGNQFLK
jgi:hypothetical protein